MLLEELGNCVATQDLAASSCLRLHEVANASLVVRVVLHVLTPSLAVLFIFAPQQRRYWFAESLVPLVSTGCVDLIQQILISVLRFCVDSHVLQ